MMVAIEDATVVRIEEVVVVEDVREADLQEIGDDRPPLAEGDLDRTLLKGDAPVGVVGAEADRVVDHPQG